MPTPAAQGPTKGEVVRAATRIADRGHELMREMARIVAEAEQLAESCGPEGTR